MLAAMKSGRNSIGVEIDREYCRMAAARLKEEPSNLLQPVALHFETLQRDENAELVVCEERAEYGKKQKRKTEVA